MRRYRGYCCRQLMRLPQYSCVKCLSFDSIVCSRTPKMCAHFSWFSFAFLLLSFGAVQWLIIRWAMMRPDQELDIGWVSYVIIAPPLFPHFSYFFLRGNFLCLCLLPWIFHWFFFSSAFAALAFPAFRAIIFFCWRSLHLFPLHIVLKVASGYSRTSGWVGQHELPTS